MTEADNNKDTGIGGRGSSKTGWTNDPNNPPGPNGCRGGKDSPCNGFALNDTDRCYHHTHPTVKHKIKQDKRMTELSLFVTESVFNNETSDNNPLDALFNELSRTQAIVRWLGSKLDQMAKDNPEQFTETVLRELEEGTKPLPLRSHISNVNVLRRQLIRTEQGLNPWLLWFLKEREHMVRIANLLVSLGIKFDQLELSKRQGDLVVEAMQNFAALSGMTVDPLNDPAINAMIAEALDNVVRNADNVMGG